MSNTYDGLILFVPTLESGRLYITAFTQSTQLVLADNFSSNTGWTLGDWSISGGVASTAVEGSMYKGGITLNDEALYEVELDFVSGIGYVFLGTSGAETPAMSVGTNKALVTMAENVGLVGINANGGAASVDNLVVSKITLNDVWDTKTADGTLTLQFGLPETPAFLQKLMLRYRIQDSSHYFEAALERNATNTDWNLLLNVVDGTSTTLATVSDVGDVTAIRVVLSGNNHYLAIPSGDDYTLVALANSALFATETECTAIYSPDFTPTLLAVSSEQFIFGQTISAPVNGNSDFSNWTGSAADEWTLSGSGATWGGDPGAIQSAPDGSAGTGAVRLIGTSSTTATLTPSSSFTLNEWYQVEVEFTAAAVAGYYALLNGGTQIFFFLGAINRLNRLLFKAALGTTFSLKVAATPTDMVLDYKRWSHVTPMPVLSAPADGTFELAFDLNSDDVLTNHDQIQLWYRVQDESNYCMVRAMYLVATLKWQIQAYVFTSNVSGAAKLTVNDIPDRPERIRVIVSGSTHTIESDAGGVTTSRGSFSSSSFSTAEGIRALWSAGLELTDIVSS